MKCLLSCKMYFKAFFNLIQASASQSLLIFYIYTLFEKKYIQTAICSCFHGDQDTY